MSRDSAQRAIVQSPPQSSVQNIRECIQGEEGFHCHNKLFPVEKTLVVIIVHNVTTGVFVSCKTQEKGKLIDVCSWKLRFHVFASLDGTMD